MRDDSDTSIPIAGTDVSRSCLIAQILIVIVATMLHGVFLSKARPLQSANDRSRWCTVWSLIERRTFQIDEIRQQPGWDTIDMVHVDDHFYSTKPPLLTVVVAGVTWCVQRVTGWDLLNNTQEVTFAVLCIVNLVPFVVSLVAWILILNLCAKSDWTRLFVLTIAAFGTLITPFLMTLNNHTVAAASVSLALYGLLKILKSPEDSQPVWAYILCGVASGWTFANELPAAVLVLFVLLWLSRVSIKSTLVWFLPAAALPVIVLLVTNLIATGSWKPVYADYGSSKYRYVIDGVPSYWMNPQGVDQNRDRPAAYLWHCTLGHHGIFSLTPVVLLALCGWLASFGFRDRVLRGVAWISAASSIIVVAFYLSRTQNYNYGGVSCGLRWAVWLTPLWLAAMVPVLDATARSMAMRVIAILLCLVSMYSAWQPIDNPWRQPWLFKWMESRGWIDYSDPRPKLEHPLWTWFASLPQSNEPAWVEFSVAQRGIAPRIVRMTGSRIPSENGEPLAKIEVRESMGDDTSAVKIRTLTIDVTRFDQGAPPAEFLQWTDPNVTEAQQQDDLAFVRGLPRKVPYEARTTRYLKTPLRKDAFRCQLAAAHVAYAANESDPLLIYRCDTWFSNEIPFGVAQVEWHIAQSESASILFHERWTLRDCSPKPASVSDGPP